MKKVLKHAMQVVLSLSVASLLFSSCGEKEENNFDYLAVQMSKDEGWSIIDSKGKVVVEDEYDKSSLISAVYDGVYWVYAGDKFQLYSIDIPKKPIVDEEFTRATQFHAGRSAVSAPNQQIRLINTSGKTVATLDKDIKRCYEFSEDGYAVVVNTDDKYGVIDKNGKELIKPQYEGMVYKVYDGVVLAAKKMDDKKVLILNTKGKKLGTIDTEKYDCGPQFSDGKLVVVNRNSDDRKQIVIDKEGKKLFTIKKSQGSNYDKYKDGYLTFRNADDKYGIVDTEGNEVIRAKYDNIINLGKGEFAVNKNDKWGIVNTNDEEIIDFDYSGIVYFKLADNYVMKDGDEYLLIKKGSKNETLTSFYDISIGGASSYADYISVDNIVNKMMTTIEKYEKPKTAAELASDLGLDADDYRWSSSINDDVTIDDGVSLDVNISFPNMTKEKTHTETVSSYYGYYTYQRKVSDGWYWTNELPDWVSGSLSINTDGIEAKTVRKALKERLSQGRSKEDSTTYYKNVKYNGSEMKVYISVPDDENRVYFTISYGGNGGVDVEPDYYDYDGYVADSIW